MEHPRYLTAKEVQTDVQLQTLQHQTWLVRIEKRVIFQVPETADYIVEQHVTKNSIHAAKILKEQHKQAEAVLQLPQPAHQHVPPTCKLQTSHTHSSHYGFQGIHLEIYGQSQPESLDLQKSKQPHSSNIH